MSCGVGRRRGSDPALLWLWRRLAATAPMGPLAWESPYAVRASLEEAKRPPPKKIRPQQRLEEQGKLSVLRFNVGVPVVAQWLTNPTRNHEDVGSVPALAQWVNDQVLQ